MKKLNVVNILIIVVIAVVVILIFLGIQSFRPAPEVTTPVAEEFQKNDELTEVVKEEAEMDWEKKRETIMQEFDKIWAELQQSMAQELRGLNQDEINTKLTPLVIARVAKKLGIEEEKIETALSQSE